MTSAADLTAPEHEHSAAIDEAARWLAVTPMGLQSEPFEIDKRVGPEKLRERLAGYGATASEISLLISGRRIEIDAMVDPIAVVRFIERKLVENGIGKVVPDEQTLAAHFRKAAFDCRLDKALRPLRDQMLAELTLFAQTMRESPDLDVTAPRLTDLVHEHLRQSPEDTWVQAVDAVAEAMEGSEA